MAKANILKLLKFDQDVREAVSSGRRLRNCTLIAPTGRGFTASSQVCFIGVDAINTKNGPVVAAAASMQCLNWNESLKTEVERLTKGGKNQADAGRNKLSEALLQQTVWGVGLVEEVQARKIGEVQASQIAMLKAIDVVLSKLSNSEDVVIIVDESKTMFQLRYAQMAISNGEGRSASVAAASVVAGTYKSIIVEQRSQSMVDYSPQPAADYAPLALPQPAPQYSPPPLPQHLQIMSFLPTQSATFTPPPDETHVERYLKYVSPDVVSFQQ